MTCACRHGPQLLQCDSSPFGLNVPGTSSAPNTQPESPSAGRGELRHAPCTIGICVLRYRNATRSRSRCTARPHFMPASVFQLSPRRCAMLLALAIAFIYAVTIRAGHEWGDDFAMYILQAKHITEGQWSAPVEYIYNPALPAMGPPAYPPLFPLLLAPIYGMFGMDLRLMKMEQVLFLAAAFYFLFELSRTKLGSKPPLLLVAVSAASPYLWQAKEHITSDIPFLFFCFLALILIAKNEQTEWQNLKLALSAGVVTYLCFATRTVGIALLPPLVAQALLKRRCHRNNALSAGLACLLFIVHWLVFRSKGSYIDQLSGILRSIPHNIQIHSWNLARLYLAGNGSFGLFLFVVFVILFAVGFVRQCRVNPGSPEAFFLCYGGVILLWPSDNDPRFLLPLFPLAVIYAGIALAELPRARSRWVTAVLVACLSMNYMIGYRHSTTKSITEGIGDPDFVRMCNFLTANTSRDSVVVFSKPRLLGLLTGRRASAYRDAAPTSELTGYLGRIKASYILQYDGFESDRQYLAEYLTHHARSVSEVLRYGQYHLYTVQAAGLPSGD